MADSKGDDFVSEAWHGIESFEKKDRTFDCVACATHYTPAEGQWIFYDLCDACFEVFELQKMKGRLWFLGDRTTPEPIHGKDYFESCREWLSHRSGAA